MDYRCVTCVTYIICVYPRPVFVYDDFSSHSKSRGVLKSGPFNGQTLHPVLFRDKILSHHSTGFLSIFLILCTFFLSHLLILYIAILNDDNFEYLIFFDCFFLSNDSNATNVHIV